MSSRKLCQVYRCICILFVLVVLTAIYIISFQRSQKIERQTHLELMSDMVVRQTEHSKIAQNQGPTTWDIISSSCRANLNIVRSWGFSRLDSKFQQFLIYRHCRYFPILMNHPEKCAGIVDLLMVIKSVITHYDRREVIRQTWGNEQTMGGKTIKILFLLGTSSNEEVKAHYQKLLEYENHIYQDILQWDFMDSFFNLTLKEIHFLKWFNIYCGNTRYIFKGDDDVFVNVPNILEYLEASKDLKDLFVGDVLFKAGPIRIKTSKYYMPRSLYKQRQYPPYACGGGFLMDGALARKLNGACQTLELYPIDDVFLGMCLKVLQVTPIKHDAFKTFGIIGNETSKLNWEPCFFRDIIVVHKLLPPDLINMWRRINSDLDCWQKMENVQSETLIWQEHEVKGNTIDDLQKNR